jgi:hypothetical protein
MTRRMAAAAAATLTMLLAGCGGNSADQRSGNGAAEMPAAVTQGEDAARLEAMPEGERNAVFIRAIRDAHFECQHVEKSASAGTINGAPAWTATCDNGKLWTIIIAKGGNAQVVNGAVVTDASKASNASAGMANAQ